MSEKRFKVEIIVGAKDILECIQTANQIFEYSLEHNVSVKEFMVYEERDERL